MKYEEMTISELYELRSAYEDAMIMAEEYGHVFQAARLSTYITIITAEIKRRKTEN